MEKNTFMDGNNQSMMVNGANPDMLWLQHIDYLATQSKIMKKEYSRRKRANKPFTWNDLDVMNKKIHHDLDVVMSGVENVQENKQNTNMNKKLIRLTESDLHRIVKESVNRVLNEMRPETYASYAKGREAQGQMDKAQVGKQAAIDKWNSLYGDNYSQMNQDYSISYNNEKGVPTGMKATPMDDGSVNYTYRGQDRGSKPYSQLGKYVQRGSICVMRLCHHQSNLNFRPFTNKSDGLIEHMGESL